MRKNKIKIGQALGGGFYVGDITDDGVTYHLIVAPKAEGEAVRKWMECSTGAVSSTNGPANTAAILQTVVTFPAAQFCADLRVGGFDDWCLPSKDELAVANKARKALADVGETFADNSFWSSSEASAPDAWFQSFYSGTPGLQNYDSKTPAYSVRAFRRLSI